MLNGRGGDVEFLVPSLFYFSYTEKAENSSLTYKFCHFYKSDFTKIHNICLVTVVSHVDKGITFICNKIKICKGQKNG